MTSTMPPTDGSSSVSRTFQRSGRRAGGCDPGGASGDGQGGADRQVHAESRARAQHAAHLDFAARLTHESIHLTQAEPRALAGGPWSVKNGSKIRLITASFMPSPRSVDAHFRGSGRGPGFGNSSADSSTTCVCTMISPPAVLASVAFTSRFNIDASNCAGSISETASSAHKRSTSEIDSPVARFNSGSHSRIRSFRSQACGCSG